MKNGKFETINKKEIEAGFINSEMVDFEDRINSDSKFREKIEKEVYSDPEVLEALCF